MKVNEAIGIVNKRYPGMRINGRPMVWKTKFCFMLVPKDYNEAEPYWNSTITAVDSDTGKVSQFSALKYPDFMNNAIPLN